MRNLVFLLALAIIPVFANGQEKPEQINVGSAPNDRTGDPIRTAFLKYNRTVIAAWDSLHNHMVYFDVVFDSLNRHDTRLKALMDSIISHSTKFSTGGSNNSSNWIDSSGYILLSPDTNVVVLRNNKVSGSKLVILNTNTGIGYFVDNIGTNQGGFIRNRSIGNGLFILNDGIGTGLQIRGINNGGKILDVHDPSDVSTLYITPSGAISMDDSLTLGVIDDPSPGTILGLSPNSKVKPINLPVPIGIEVTTETLVSGADSVYVLPIPDALAGMNIIKVEAQPGEITGDRTMSVKAYRNRGGTVTTITSTGASYTTPAVINTSYDDLQKNDKIFVGYTFSGGTTTGKGLWVTIYAQKP